MKSRENREVRQFLISECSVTVDDLAEKVPDCVSKTSYDEKLACLQGVDEKLFISAASNVLITSTSGLTYRPFIGDEFLPNALPDMLLATYRLGTLFS